MSTTAFFPSVFTTWNQPRLLVLFLSVYDESLLWKMLVKSAEALHNKERSLAGSHAVRASSGPRQRPRGSHDVTPTESRPVFQ